MPVRAALTTLPLGATGGGRPGGGPVLRRSNRRSFRRCELERLQAEQDHRLTQASLAEGALRRDLDRTAAALARLMDEREDLLLRQEESARREETLRAQAAKKEECMLKQVSWLGLRLAARQPRLAAAAPAVVGRPAAAVSRGRWRRWTWRRSAAACRRTCGT